MPHRTLDLGIAAIQANSPAEGARLIRIALRHPALTGDLKAIAYLWLAESVDDATQKRAFYQQALAADPTNTDARQRLARLMTSGLPAASNASAQVAPLAPPLPPETPSAPTPAPPTSAGINVAEQLANLIGGPNGAGTGVFVHPDGLLATTRAVVGSETRVMAELHDGRQIQGQVVRAYPEFDLAFVQLAHKLPSLLPITSSSRVEPETPLTLVHYSGDLLRGAQRPTKRALPAQWIPTTFTEVADAGGAPLFDERNQLVGLITTNTGLTSRYLYGLHIAAIRRALDSYLMEAQTARRAYCPTCGTSSRASGAGYYYCEVCGGTLPAARAIPRTYFPQAAAMYDQGGAACVLCGSRAGLYQGRCLRCGRAQV